MSGWGEGKRGEGKGRKGDAGEDEEKGKRLFCLFICLFFLPLPLLSKPREREKERKKSQFRALNKTLDCFSYKDEEPFSPDVADAGNEAPTSALSVRKGLGTHVLLLIRWELTRQADTSTSAQVSEGGIFYL